MTIAPIERLLISLYGLNNIGLCGLESSDTCEVADLLDVACSGDWAAAQQLLQDGRDQGNGAMWSAPTREIGKCE